MSKTHIRVTLDFTVFIFCILLGSPKPPRQGQMRHIPAEEAGMPLLHQEIPLSFSQERKSSPLRNAQAGGLLHSKVGGFSSTKYIQ